MGNKKKWIINCIAFVLIVSLTVYAIFHNEDPEELFKLLKTAKAAYLFIALLFVVLFISCESAVLRIMLNNVNQSPKKGHCLLYSFIGFFFSSITPAAGGGQPSQVYFMQRDEIDPGVSTPILVFVTICYKSVLVLCGALVFILRPYDFLDSNKIARLWCIAGWGINVIAVTFFLLLIFFPSVIERFVYIVISILSKFMKKERITNWKDYLSNSLLRYREVSKSILKNKKLFITIFAICILQRFILFSVTWLVLKSFGINSPLFYTVLLQSMVSLGTDLLPLPGGSGANEALFILLFESVCGKNMVIPTLIASRGISYYGQLLICGTVFLIFMIYNAKQGDL